MALGTNHRTITTETKFIPELWSDEVIAVYEKNLVIANLVKKISFAGKKGDTLHIPKPVRGSANAKVAETQVVLNTTTATELVITIDQHFEYSMVIEDITSIQALASMRAFYTTDAGYALAKQIDTALSAIASGWQGGTAYSKAYIGSTGATVWDGSASTNTGNGASITDIGLRRSMQRLDDTETPFDNRALVVPPSEKNVMLGIDRFNSTDFTNVQGVKTGIFGEVYGMPVYVTTNLPTITADDTTTLYKAALMFHEEAIVFVEQMGVRTQTQYKQEYLGDLFTADTLYGKSEYRDTNGVVLVVPA